MLSKEIQITGCKKCVAVSAVLAVVSAVVAFLFSGNLLAGEGFMVKGIVALVCAAVFSLLWFGWRFRSLGGFAPAVCITFVMVVDCLFALALSAVFGDSALISVFVTGLVTVVLTCVVFGCLQDNAKMYKAMEKAELATKSVNQTKKSALMACLLVVAAMVLLAVVCAAMGVASLIGIAVSVLLGCALSLFTALDVAPNLWVVLRKK